ncbi:MAG: hypothetical protein DRI90_14730, partial [Deltaproteobacteria bacterium]
MRHQRPWLDTAAGLALAILALVVGSRTTTWAATLSQPALGQPALAQPALAQRAPSAALASGTGGLAGAPAEPQVAVAALQLAAGPRTAALSSRPPAVSYQMQVRLDPVEHQIHGTGTIRWHNGSQVAQRELYLHLYLNAFKNERTLFMRSPG